MAWPYVPSPLAEKVKDKLVSSHAERLAAAQALLQHDTAPAMAYGKDDF